MPEGQPVQSFRERKQAELARESTPAPQPERAPVSSEDPVDRIPSQEFTESAEDVLDGAPEQDEQYADEEPLGDEGALSEDLDDDDEIPEQEAAPDEEEERVDWEKRYKDLQSETQQIRDTHEEVEREFAEQSAEALRYKFALEDKFKEAEQRAAFLANVMSGNAAQFENINWQQVSPDDLPALKQQAQNAFALKQQSEQAYANLTQQLNEERTALKKRDAAIAKMRLKRTIGLNSEVYQGLREFATASGMPVETFNELTDPVVLEWAHAAMRLKQAPSTVTGTNRRRRPKAPGSRNSRQQRRNARGQFEKAKSTLRSNPGDPQARSDFFRNKLAAERQGR